MMEKNNSRKLELHFSKKEKDKETSEGQVGKEQDPVFDKLIWMIQYSDRHYLLPF